MTSKSPQREPPNTEIRWYALPLIILFVVLSLIISVKLGYLAYEAIIDWDHVKYCPSSGHVSDIKDCIKCPINANCDDEGNMICKPGYTKSARDWVNDKEYTETAIQFAKEFHKNYLYYLGDIEWGLTVKTYNIHEYIESRIRNTSKDRIEAFVESRDNINFKDFATEIKTNYKNYWESDKTPRFGLIWAIRKNFRDNFILIVVGLIVFWIASYQGVKLVYSQIYKHKARSIYGKLEHELKELSNSGDIGHGLSENEIIQGFKGEMSESAFQSYIMPYLNSFRAQNKKVKTFDQDVDGNYVTKWQYLGAR